MAKKAQQDPEPIEVESLPAAAESVVVSAGHARTQWWPVAALAALLIAFATTMVTIPGVLPAAHDAKAAYLQATPRLEGLDAITAPEPTVIPDPASFAQKIDIILPPPPPPPVAKSGGIALNRADAAAFCANINSQRVANGRPALASCYATSARQQHANAMAATNPPNIWHQGDNIVGVAPSHSKLIAAFMASQAHHDQILTASYTGAKVGCAWGQPPGYVPLLYCTADFF